VRSRSTVWVSARCSSPVLACSGRPATRALPAHLRLVACSDDAAVPLEALLIPGTSSIEHLEQNMAAIDIELDDADLAALDRVD